MSLDTTPRRFYHSAVFWIVVGLLAGLLVGFGPRLVRLPGLVRQARAEVAYWSAVRSDGLRGLSRAGAADELAAHLDAARRLVSAARRDWGFAVQAAAWFGWVPGIGGDLAALPHLLDMGQNLLDGGALLYAEAKPAVAALPDGMGAMLATLATRPSGNATALRDAEQALRRAAEAWARVDTPRLSPRLARFAPLLDRALPVLAAAPDLLAAAPELLGADGLRRYLILAQNGDEIRATGGFISGVGIVEVERGEIKSITFTDSYSVIDLTKPHPIPPIALETHMWAQILLLRDANWWADFPTSARKAWELYEQDTGQRVHGVVAMDTPALQLLVAATDPIRLDEYDDTITADNLMERIQHYWASPVGGPTITSDDPKWWKLRKNFMGVLAKAVVQRLLKDTAKLDMGEVGQAALRLLDERHLLLYLPPVQDTLREQKWDGGIVPAQGDYLFVVDSNVGFNKVNPMIQQAITYTVNLDDATATLRIRYAHGSQARLDVCVHESRYGDTYQDMMDRCYWDYVRVFVPAGAELLSREGLEDGDLAESEAGLAVWDGLLVLKPGEAQEVVFRYRLPASVVGGETYRLHVQKQPGTWGIPLRVVVRGAGGAVREFQTDLTVDREFAISP
ncbi:MAG: hypothetical protein Kow00123_24490 [Anaerolineales bacterium]